MNDSLASYSRCSFDNFIGNGYVPSYRGGSRRSGPLDFLGSDRVLSLLIFVVSPQYSHPHFFWQIFRAIAVVCSVRPLTVTSVASLLLLSGRFLAQANWIVVFSSPRYSVIARFELWIDIRQHLSQEKRIMRNSNEPPRCLITRVKLLQIIMVPTQSTPFSAPHLSSAFVVIAHVLQGKLNKNGR